MNNSWLCLWNVYTMNSKLINDIRMFNLTCSIQAAYILTGMHISSRNLHRKTDKFKNWKFNFAETFGWKIIFLFEPLLTLFYNYYLTHKINKRWIINTLKVLLFSTDETTSALYSHWQMKLVTFSNNLHFFSKTIKTLILKISKIIQSALF